MTRRFDGISPNDRILRSRFDQTRTLVARTAPGAEDARKRLEIRHTSFLLKIVCSPEMRKARGSGVELSAQIFLT